MYWIKVHEIPEAGPNTKGKAIVNLLELEKHEKVATTVAVREFAADRYLVFATERGTIKKTPLSAYANQRAAGIIAIQIDEGDRLLTVRVTDGNREILIATANGLAIRFPEAEVRSMGRSAYGVNGIRLRQGDRVVTMEALEPEGEILTVTEGGYGKRTPLAEYRLQGRLGYGIINLKVSEKTGPVAGVRQVVPGDGLMLITQEGKIIRLNVEGIRVIGRSTQGVKLMDLEGEDRIVAVAKLADGADAGDITEEGAVGEVAAIAVLDELLEGESGPEPEEPVN
jgi:DNA gyrase subunit A